MLLVDETHHKALVIYCVGTSAENVWKNVIETEWMGTGVTREELYQQGYRAKKVSIVRPTEEQIS
jgi:hypothetical protein